MMAGSLATVAVIGSSMWPAPACAASHGWRNCGTVQQRARNGYVSANRVDARSYITCDVALHIGLRFSSGGYSYDGLTCFYASMGSGDPYWNWSCGVGRAGDRSGDVTEVRGHLTVTKVRR
jgi:hypothetical protein